MALKKILESTKQKRVPSKAEEALHELDGCWACEDMDGALEHEILSIRKQEARAVETN